jgi:hypothetical protein
MDAMGGAISSQKSMNSLLSCKSPDFGSLASLSSLPTEIADRNDRSEMTDPEARTINLEQHQPKILKRTDPRSFFERFTLIRPDTVFRFPSFSLLRPNHTN